MLDLPTLFGAHFGGVWVNFFFFFLCWYFIKCGFVLSLVFCLCDIFVYVTSCMHSTVSNPIVLYNFYLHKQTIHSKQMIIEVNTCITVMRFTYKLKDIHFRFLLVLGFLEWILSNVSNDSFTKGWDPPPICSSLAVCVPLSTWWLNVCWTVQLMFLLNDRMLIWWFCSTVFDNFCCCYHLIMFNGIILSLWKIVMSQLQWNKVFKHQYSVRW